MGAQTTLISRRDTALAPWLMIMWVSIAVAISTALRPSGGPPATLTTAVALSYAALAGTLSAFQESAVMRRARESLVTYLVGSVLLVGLLCLVAVRDDGVTTIFFAPIVQVGMYLGLVLPRGWARGWLAILLIAIAGVEYAHPAATLAPALLLGFLTVAGWQVGRICHRAHDGTARAAQRIAHTDLLTGSLNRRGFVHDLEARIGRAKPGNGIALLLIDLDKIAEINDRASRGAGDRAIAAAGEQVADLVPRGGTVGRLGGNDFAVALPSADPAAAISVAEQIRAALRDRTGCQVGIAITEDSGTTVDDFLRIAQAAQDAAATTPERALRPLVAGSTRGNRTKPALTTADVTYEQVRSSERRQTAPTAGIRLGNVARDGFWIIAIAGAVTIAAAAYDGVSSLAEQVMVYAGPAWVLANLMLGWFIGRPEHISETRAAVARYSSAVLLAVGVTLAAIAFGGIASPIIAAFYIKVMFDAAVLPTRSAAATTAITIVGWAVAAALTPWSDLWVVPYQATLLGVSFGLGAVGRRAFVDARSQQLRLAHTDVVTGLRNRPGFMQGAERAVAEARNGQPLTIIAFDVALDAVTPERGVEEPDRDETLQQVGELMREAFPDAYSLSRIGGEEFVAALPIASVSEASALAGVLAARLEDLAPASVGCAVYPDDGDTLDALLLRADHRAYSPNPARTRHSPLSVSGDSAAA